MGCQRVGARLLAAVALPARGGAGLALGVPPPPTVVGELFVTGSI